MLNQMLRRLLYGKTVKISLQFQDETSFDKVNSILMYSVCGEIKHTFVNGESWYEIPVYPYHMKHLFEEVQRYNIKVVVED